MIRPIICALVLTCSVVVLSSAHVGAQTMPMSDDQLQRIRDNCQSAQTTLIRLRVSDALLRVNRGQLYDLLSSKLMSRLNSRLALNKLDASGMVSVTANFDQELNNFRSRYSSYVDQLSSTIRMDCKKQPADFYAAVAKTRSLRQNVHDSIQSLGHYIDDYKREFSIFRETFHESKQGNKT